jgi:hypothetical protein
MALHTQLPIYKVAYDLLSVATDYVQNMPRPFKAAIGGRVRDLCVDLVLLIFKANCARDKVPHLDTLLERLEELNLLLRLCRDKRFISTGQYAKAIELTASVGKQANGWRKHNASSPVA